MDQLGFNIQGIIITLIALFGIIGNILCLIVLTKSEMIKLPTTTFLIGLSVADIAFLFFFCINYYLNTPFLRDIIIHVGMTCSALFAVAISADRFIAVWYPFQAKQICTRKRAVLISIAIVVIPLIIYIITVLTVNFTSIDIQDNKPNIKGESGTVGMDLVVWYADLVCVITVLFIPYPLLIGLNLCVWVKLRRFIKTRSIRLKQSVKNGRNTSTSNNNKATVMKESEMALTRMLIILVIVFGISYAPFHITFTIEHIMNVRISFPIWWYQISIALLELNSCINFIIYYAFGNQFRKSFKQVFGCFSKSEYQLPEDNTKNSGARSTQLIDMPLQ